MRLQSIAPIMLILFSITILSNAQDTYTYQSHEMTIEGTSTIHDWVSDVNQLSGTAMLTVQNGQLQGIQSLEIKIPVKSIKSSKGSIMDNKTYDALESDDHPNILFKLMQVQSITSNGNGYTVKTKGYLTIAGNKRLVDMSVTATVNSNGSVTFTGAKALKMTSFSIDPPTAMLGTLKTADDITIKFKMNLDLIQG